MDGTSLTFKPERVTGARDAPAVLCNARGRGPAPTAWWCSVSSRRSHYAASPREEESLLPFASPLQGRLNMSYAKLLSALARANATNVNKMLASPGRCRSTVASAKSQEERSQVEGCAVVEAEPVELISHTKASPKARRTHVKVDFDNTQEAYKSKGNIELLRSLLVFRLCAVDVLVEKNKEVRSKAVACVLTVRLI